jgi:catechol 2,3-dioxygenase-like lactoylglutathione lyase family enzyme
MKGEGVEGAATRVTSSVLFVSRLNRSIEFYCDVFSCAASIHYPDAALLLAPDGFQIYLIARGSRAEHPSGGIRLQHLIWAADSDAELRDIAQTLQERVGQTSSCTSGGVSFLAARDPDGIRVLVAHPSPEKQPRSVRGARLYVRKCPRDSERAAPSFLPTIGNHQRWM